METDDTLTTHSGRHDLSRILAISDGVFAIVITLLVFDVKVPPAPPGHLFTDAELRAVLWEMIPKLLAYVTTFIVIGVYWTGHHAIFKHIERYDRNFLWLNMLFLICLCSMPVPTALLSNYWWLQTAVMIYGAALIATGIALWLVWCYASNHHRLVNPSLSPNVIRIGRQRILMGPLAAMVSVIISPFSVKLSLWIYLLAAVAYFLPSRLDKFQK